MWRNKKRKLKHASDDDDDEVDEEDCCVNVVKNHIYFYGAISETSLFKFNMSLQKVENTLRNTIDHDDIHKLTVYIHIFSTGGDLYAGFALMDIIRNCSLHTVGIVEGQAASSATIMLMGCDKRLMTKTSFMLIHQITSAFWGSANQWEDESKNMKTITKKLKKIYRKHTKLTDRDLDNILLHDIYWGARKCVRLGLVDEIVNVSS
jgi:ATP-dependent protease ClpP protease subunit